MSQQCECPAAGYCHRYRRVMNERQHSFCDGTSGLPREKEEFYLGVLRDGPSLLSQAASLVAAATDHVIHGLPMVSGPERAARLAICSSCEHYDAGKCRLCGCNMTVKAGWKRQDCPVGKWDGLRPSQ